MSFLWVLGGLLFVLVCVGVLLILALYWVHYPYGRKGKNRKPRKK